MGEPKQLLPLGSKSLLRRAAEHALGSVCRPVVVVTGALSALTRAEIADLPVSVIDNPAWASGMGSSIRAGVAEIVERRGDTTTAIVITVCDQPFVTTEIIDELVAARRRTDAGIVASEYGGTLGVPALFDRRHFAELLAADDASGAKRIIARHLADVHRLPFAHGAFDIDTPEDYERLKNIAAFTSA